MIVSALITGSDWWAVAAFLAAFGVGAAWEVRGIVKHDDHLVDTISEMYWSVRDRSGTLQAVLAVSLGAFFVWLWWHFTFEGRQRRETRLRRAGLLTDEERGDVAG